MYARLTDGYTARLRPGMVKARIDDDIPHSKKEAV
jgi:hypothetical protein